MSELKELVALQWSGDMIDFILKSQKYVQFGDAYVSVTGLKPTIDSDMWYDDEYEGPSETFEAFRGYNIRYNAPNEFTLHRSYLGEQAWLYRMPKYHNDKTGNRLQGLSYERQQPEVGQQVTPAELEVINQAVREVREDFEKRLRVYWKKYSHKVMARGYWANR